jgi:hypothetical protein
MVFLWRNTGKKGNSRVKMALLEKMAFELALIGFIRKDGSETIILGFFFFEWSK